MAKKYLSLEEAAQEAGISTDELKQLRQNGEIRGFSDAGAGWKFKADDIEELKRKRQADSNPDVPLLTDEELDADSSIIGMEEEDLVSEQPTVIRNSSALDEDEDDDAFLVGMSSDSDVQLIPNELLTDDGGLDMVSMGDSDSDVRLVDSSPSLTDPGSDSDVKLVGGSDSDVQIVGGSDSDVQIMEDDSDSDVQLVDDAKTEENIPVMEDDSDSDVALVPPGSGVTLESGDTDASVFDEDESGISLGDGSSITLAAESGISLEKIDSDLDLQEGKQKQEKEDDSGLALSHDDSGISLEGFDDDSGISLMDDDDDDVFGFADDSGIELTPADSGIALESLGDSGIALDDASAGQTQAMTARSDFRDDDDDTAMEMATMDDDSEFELAMDGSGSSGDNVIMFDDDADVDDRGATVVKKKGEMSEEFDLTSDGDFDVDDAFDEVDEFDEFDEAAGFDDEFEDDLDVADDVVGEDDELDDLDVFDDGADDFDDDFDAGTSSPDFVASPAGFGQPTAVAAPPQAEWGVGPFVGLLFSTLLMAVCGMMMFDLVRSMWSWNDPSGFNSPLLSIIKDMI